ncbi:alpha-galactosidase [Kineococcus sp. NUM-3379]
MGSVEDRGVGDREPGSGLLHWRAAGVSVVLDLREGFLPAVLHWGADLGDVDGAELADLAVAARRPVAPNQLDVPVRLGVLPEHARGWGGTPGLAGHRAGGADWSPDFTVVSAEESTGESTGGTTGGSAAGGGSRRLVVEAADATARLGLRLELELTPQGVLRARAAVRNTGTTPYVVDGLTLALPVPEVATEVLDLAGRWSKERIPQRTEFRVGTRLRENRRGRTGADASLLLVAGTAGFGFRSGEVWGLHVAWSGNHRELAERLASGEKVLAGGEVLLPGEVELAAGEEHEGPWLYAAYGRDGLDELSARLHAHVRARPNHPARPRPVLLNVWEAVYFDHRLDRLTALADAAAEVGVERYVLDDGWFRHRRDDTAGLGDWYVDEDVWPQGLHPLVEHVRGLGLEFGLWVEPEMVNPDSDLYRAHPDWVLTTGVQRNLTSRRQLVLDLGNPDVFAHVLGRLDALVTEYSLTYLKWDHNRDLVDAGTGPLRAAGVHVQTRAVYRLLDELRRRHPDLEIESCSSGGARVDLGILERTDRVWASDCIDALERQDIDPWTQALLPPELVGSHIGSPHSHTTGRTHELAFRAGTALFGHLGIEWDLTRAEPRERAELARWIALHKELRPLLHGGLVVREDDPDPSLRVRGVVAHDGSEAVFAVARVAAGVTAPPPRLRLPGLDPQRRYRVAAVPLADGGPDAPAWSAGVTLGGRALGRAGLAVPNLRPERLVLLRAQAVDGG